MQKMILAKRWSQAGELEAEFGEMGGYTAESDAASLLSELGVKESTQPVLMKDLPGAMKVRSCWPRHCLEIPTSDPR